MNKTQQGLNYLSQEKIKKALEVLSLEFAKNPNNQEAKIGILLCDIASSNLQKAMGLLEFYYILLSEEGSSIAQKKILEIIQSIDKKESQEFDNLSQSFTQNTESLECISYEDFKHFMMKKQNFKEAFEDFTLSTKIAFAHKEELYEFLNLLIDQGYANLSLQYAENIGENLGFDPKINQILQRALKNLR